MGMIDRIGSSLRGRWDDHVRGLEEDARHRRPPTEASSFTKFALAATAVVVIVLVGGAIVALTGEWPPEQRIAISVAWALSGILFAVVRSRKHRHAAADSDEKADSVRPISDR